MKDTNAALIFVGVLAAGLGSAKAQQPAIPPYSPTTNELRSQAKPVPEERVVRLEQRVTALEDLLADEFNGAGEVPGRPAQQPPQNHPQQPNLNAGAQEPVAGGTMPVKGPSGGQYHTIQEGETLHGIARKYGMSLDALVANNRNLDPYGPIYIGDRLWIPTVNPPRDTPPAPAGPHPGVAAWSAPYKVQTGDTVHSIARRAGVSPQEIAYHNRLANVDQIFVGQLLVLPAGRAPVNTVPQDPRPQTQAPASTQAEETYHYYDVLAGDTLGTIAKTFFTTELELMALNQLGGNQLQVGQRIVVPTRLYFEFLNRQRQSPLS